METVEPKSDNKSISSTEKKNNDPEINFLNKEIIQIANNFLKFPTKHIKNLSSQNEKENYLNRRVELNDYCGTIKYIGSLKHKKEPEAELWLGIEWDDERRGKHNGTIENFKYFETKDQKNSGSLIKISKVNFGLNLEEALNFKYNFENQKNEMYAFMSNFVESEAYIQAKRKRIEIEFVGKDKAIKKYSDYKTFARIDLGCSHLGWISDIKTDLAALFPNVRELNLTRSLLSKWSEFVLLLVSLKNLESLNFTENKLTFDEEFFEIKKIMKNEGNQFDGFFNCKNKENLILHYRESDNNENDFDDNKRNFSVIRKIAQNFSSADQIRNNLKLKSLILNKNHLCLEDVIKISFLLPSIENLYLFDNQINDHNITESLAEEQVTEFKTNLDNLRGLILEKNNISIKEHILCFFPHKNLAFLNLSQNNIKHLISTELCERSLSQNQNISLNNKVDNKSSKSFDFRAFFGNLKILNLDFNGVYDYEILFNQLKYLSNLEELNILNNGFVRNQNLGLENAEVNIIGRMLNLLVLNNSTISKGMKRDSELEYLKNSVKKYFTEKLKGEFDREIFEAHMKDFHPNYFILKKKYFDPVEDFIEGIKTVNTNTIKGSMVELTFMHKNKIIKKKFPKTTTFYNLKNLLMKLFKITENYSFRIISGCLIEKLKLFNFKKSFDQIEKEEHSLDEIFDITDESKPLEDYNITDKDVILLV